MFEYSLQLCIFCRSHVKIWLWELQCISTECAQQWTSLCFWIFCFINCSGTLAYRARFRTWIENKGWFCHKIFGCMSVLRCHGFWSQLGIFGIYPIQRETTGQTRCLPKLLLIVYGKRPHAFHKGISTVLHAQVKPIITLKLYLRLL